MGSTYTLIVEDILYILYVILPYINVMKEKCLRLEEYIIILFIYECDRDI